MFLLTKVICRCLILSSSKAFWVHANFFVFDHFCNGNNFVIVEIEYETPRVPFYIVHFCIYTYVPYIEKYGGRNLYQKLYP